MRRRRIVSTVVATEAMENMQITKESAVSGAAQYLSNLPSRGLFSSNVLSSNMGGLCTYISDRDTSPPEEQIIRTNQTNILIRSLALKKQKCDSSVKDRKFKASAENSKGKRSVEGTPESKNSSKRAKTTGGADSPLQGSSNRTLNEYHTLTVDKLRGMLKERGLPIKGKKDELIARLRNNNPET